MHGTSKVNEPSSTLGTVLRELRSQREWTLREMSDRSGIPISTLSKIEHDQLTLGYDKLLQLSENLGISVSELFSQKPGIPSAQITARRSIARAGDAIRVITPHYDYLYLCHDIRHKHIVPSISKVLAHSLEEYGELARHSGEEFIYVLEGRIIAHTEFYDPVEIAMGESIYIDSNMGHAYVLAPGCESAQLLGICTIDNAYESEQTYERIEV
jgi:transcriptional regulator with XRE-family HTH domain